MSENLVIERKVRPGTRTEKKEHQQRTLVTERRRLSCSSQLKDSKLPKDYVQ